MYLKNYFFNKYFLCGLDRRPTGQPLCGAGQPALPPLVFFNWAAEYKMGFILDFFYLVELQNYVCIF